jgi:hypothetical protein
MKRLRENIPRVQGLYQQALRSGAARAPVAPSAGAAGGGGGGIPIIR